ncbi:MAG: hypothetical protein CLLPBCKN_001838 [Chroococcidiopsis cubana SAG 39.79]|uniref:hypothetical protein n=1 Tax=Chroococcidiopsis cubana TaxID=171392 RepID=UPI002AC3A4EB|nr:hypothetical protein [Chroococcidiopsis cubana]MDZ4872450.1 hypothetical protein [Chroococcidiopsis cubana SAG 39.79]
MNVKFFHSTAIVFSFATVVAVASELPASAQTANPKISTSAAALKDRLRVNTIAQADPTYPSTQPSTPTTDQRIPALNHLLPLQIQRIPALNHLLPLQIQRLLLQNQLPQQNHQQLIQIQLNQDRLPVVVLAT